jgi:hypothetical protein
MLNAQCGDGSRDIIIPTMAEVYTLKEMLAEVRENQKKDSLLIVQTLAHAEKVDKHLELLNSKVAAQEKRVTGLETFQTRAMIIWSAAVFVVVTVANKFI